MSETQVQISNEPGGESAPSQTPYQNLWVPLVLVPAGIIMAIVAVIALFGGLAGSEKTPEDNLELVANGGKNERTQALAQLVFQVEAINEAKRLGNDAPWSLPVGFGGRVIDELARLDEDDLRARAALGAVLAYLEDERSVDVLTGILRLSDGEDESNELRFLALKALGRYGHDGAAGIVIGFLDHQAVELRAAAAAALANLDAPEARKRLIGALEDSELVVSGTAAYALAKLDPPGYEAASLLRQMTGKGIYDAARERDRTQFTRAQDVSDSRRKALSFLALLDREEDWAFIGTLEDTEDLNVRELVLALIAKHEKEGEEL